MKNVIRFVALCLAFGLTASAFSKTANLIGNSSFEQPLSSQHAWQGGKYVSRTDQAAYQGNYAARILAMEPQRGHFVRLWSSYIPYTDGPLTVSAWLKAQNVVPGKKSWNIGLFHIHFYDQNKQQIGSHSSIKSIKGTTNWQSAKKSYYPVSMKKDKWHTIPAGTAYFRLEFLLSACTGTLLIDDVSVIGQQQAQPKPVKGKKAAPTKGNTANMTAGEKAEYARLLLATRKRKEKRIQHRDDKNLLVMEDIVLPKKTFNPQQNFPNVPKMEVKKGDIYLNGKPAMMLGVENHFRLYPHLYKLLGMDFVILAISDSANTNVKKLDSKAYQVSWRDYTWLETLMKILADEGLWSYLDFWIGGIPVRERFPDMAIQDPPQHFIWLRFTNPAVRRYLYNYSRSISKLSRKYPVFVYEFLNEIMYTSPYHPTNLAMFREQMAKRYGSIERANQIWGTNFNSFATVMPPKKGGVNGSMLNLPKGFSQRLFCDYTKFSEKLLAKHVKDWDDDFQKTEPNGLTLVQAINGMWMDYGNQGVNPELVVDSEDALGVECGITFVPQPTGTENLESIKNMTIRLMTRDVWRSVSPNKPLIDGESPLSVSTPPIPKPFVNLEGEWKFKSYAADSGKSEKKRQADTIDTDSDKSWTQLNYDDSSWKSITVPGMWGKEGFAKTYIGLYRKKVFIPEFRGPLFLAGKQLADYADIYINGKLVHQTKIWSESFCVNIAKQVKQGNDNELAIRLYNKYYEGNMYWGGIRGSIQIVRSSAELQPLTPGQMRSYLWSCAAHGYSATAVTYFYSNEGIDYPFSLFNPAYISREAMKEIPKVKKEIETLAEIVLPRPRIKGKVGLLYPFEYFRYHIAKDAVESLRAPLSKNLLDYYQAMLFKQIPFDMVTSQQILDDKINNYKALVFRMADMVKPGVVEKLKQYVENGGFVIIDHGSLQRENKYYQPISIENLIGGNVGAAVTDAQQVSFKQLQLPDSKTVKRQLADSFGVKVNPKSATVVAAYADGSAAITLNKLGKGQVMYIGCELPYDVRKAFLHKTLQNAGIDGDISVAGSNGLGNFVEGHQFNRDGRHVWYLNNWGESATITVKPVKPFSADTTYRVRNMVTGKALKSESGSSKWSAEELNQGIKLAIQSQNPIVLLVESSQTVPLKRLELSKSHLEQLDKTWLRSKPAEFRILVDCKRASLYSPARTASLTWLLEEHDYQVINSVSRLGDKIKTANNDLISEEKLADFNVLSLPGIAAIGGTRGFSKEELKTIESYVRNGGGLFLTGQFMRGPHGHMSSAYASKVADMFGVKVLRDAVVDPENHIMGETRFVSFSPKGNSPLLKGVKKFQSLGMAPLMITGKNVDPVIATATSAKSVYSRRKGELPVMAALEYGKGRVVIMGDGSWMQPYMLDRGDNAQLALNIFNWLAKRPVSVLPKQELKKIIDTSIKND